MFFEHPDYEFSGWSLAQLLPLSQHVFGHVSLCPPRLVSKRPNTPIFLRLNEQSCTGRQGNIHVCWLISVEKELSSIRQQRINLGEKHFGFFEAVGCPLRINTQSLAKLKAEDWECQLDQPALPLRDLGVVVAPQFQQGVVSTWRIESLNKCSSQECAHITNSLRT